MHLLIALAAGLLAFANGANDNAKGVATVIGTGLMSRRGAIVFAGVTTLTGSIAAIGLGAALASTFKGRGIVDDAVWQQPAFAACVGLAAAATVLAATRLSMPISTTHAMVGAIIGVGVASSGLIWSAVWASFFRPLLIAPVLAGGLAFVLYGVMRVARRRLGLEPESCVCITAGAPAVQVGGAVAACSGAINVVAGDAAHCGGAAPAVAVEASKALTVGHLLSSGTLNFARGLNDTPKVAAMLIAIDLTHDAVAVAGVGLAILVGGIVAVHRVAQTMSYRITAMNDGQGFTANLVSAALVTTASLHGLPVSTTHVSCGSLFGIGAANRQARPKVIGQIVAAWITTLPVGAVLGFVAWKLLAR